MTTPDPRPWPDGTPAEHLALLTELYEPLPDTCRVLVPLAVVRRVHAQLALDAERLADCMARRTLGGPPPAVTAAWGNERHVPPPDSAHDERLAPPTRYGSSTPRSTPDA